MKIKKLALQMGVIAGERLSILWPDILRKRGGVKNSISEKADSAAFLSWFLQL